MSLKILYSFIELESKPDEAFPQKIKRTYPFIPIRLSCNDYFTPKFFALVDSGSTNCLFEDGFRSCLNLKIEDGKKSMITGIGGATVTHYFYHINIEIFDSQILKVVHKIPVYAGFSEGKLAGGGLLGMDGFFNTFQVTFNLFKGFFELYKRGL